MFYRQSEPCPAHGRHKVGNGTQLNPRTQIICRDPKRLHEESIQDMLHLEHVRKRHGTYTHFLHLRNAAFDWLTKDNTSRSSISVM